MLNTYLQSFKDNINSPDITLLYKLKWAQIEGHVGTENLKALDFGSGFGTTANHLAKYHDVVAIEPNVSMVEEREKENEYLQLVGSYELLKDFEDSTFDLIVCHNVLEFIAGRAQIVQEFARILKVGGVLSIVKNNNEGRILSRAVMHDLDGAADLLAGGHISNTFGDVSVYKVDELIDWSEQLTIEKVLSLQTFYGLQGKPELKREPEWMQKMFDLEMAVSDREPYKSISLFNHVLLRKNQL